MEDIIKKAVYKEERSARRRGVQNATIEVHLLKTDEDEEKFIAAKLSEINSLGNGSYTNVNRASSVDKKRGYFIFRCTRHGEHRPKSRKAAGCKAYISFKLRCDWVNYKVIVQRTFTFHSGHDPQALTEGHTEKICPQLISKIQTWLSLGVKPDIILLQAHQWAKEQGHSDINQRAYFVTPKDIDNIRTCVMRRHHLDKDDVLATTKLLESRFKDSVVFYQPFAQHTDLIIVLQTPFMKKNVKDFGRDILFFDATYCVNQYGFPLYTLAVRDSHGHGVPVAYIILGNEKQSTLELALEKLKPTFHVEPRCFMVDKDQTEINAIQSVFKGSDILLCWYHVTQAVVRWLKRTESGVSGPENTKTRDDIINFFKKMKSCATKKEFEDAAKVFLNEFADFPNVCKYFQTSWKKIGNLWADFGRCFKHGESDTNNLIERFFHRLKYQFLGGIRNRRLDDLIEVILEKTSSYFSVIQDLQSVGRVANPVQDKVEEVMESANRMLKKGWFDKIHRSTHSYHVPSEQTPDVIYNVCPAEQYCSCAIGVRGHTCKHLYLIRLLTCKDCNTFPDFNTQVQIHAVTLKQREKYCVVSNDTKELHVESLCGRGLFKPNINHGTCTCCTFSYYGYCACLILANELFDSEEESVDEIVQNLVESCENELEDRHPSTCNTLIINKLQNILETVRKWESIPDSIATEICVLHGKVNEECARLQSFQTEVNSDSSKKIKPLFPNRSKKKLGIESLNNTAELDSPKLMLDMTKAKSLTAKCKMRQIKKRRLTQRKIMCIKEIL